MVDLVGYTVLLRIATAVIRQLVRPVAFHPASADSAEHAAAQGVLARTLGELTGAARSGKTQPAEMSGGTITFINPGESTILAFGQIKDLPWVVDGQLAVRKVTTLALSFDHRIIGSELGSLFLRDVGAMLVDPLRMLVWS
ncbi:2-oxo acid dehydrogenase subunit E2 [Streptosporangium sp. NPDC003464]